MGLLSGINTAFRNAGAEVLLNGMMGRTNYYVTKTAQKAIENATEPLAGQLTKSSLKPQDLFSSSQAGDLFTTVTSGSLPDATSTAVKTTAEAASNVKPDVPQWMSPAGEPEVLSQLKAQLDPVTQNGGGFVHRATSHHASNVHQWMAPGGGGAPTVINATEIIPGVTNPDLLPLGYSPTNILAAAGDPVPVNFVTQTPHHADGISKHVPGLLESTGNALRTVQTNAEAAGNHLLTTVQNVPNQAAKAWDTAIHTSPSEAVDALGTTWNTHLADPASKLMNTDATEFVDKVGKGYKLLDANIGTFEANQWQQAKQVAGGLADSAQTSWHNLATNLQNTWANTPMGRYLADSLPDGSRHTTREMAGDTLAYLQHQGQRMGLPSTEQVIDRIRPVWKPVENLVTQVASQADGALHAVLDKAAQISHQVPIMVPNHEILHRAQDAVDAAATVAMNTPGATQVLDAVSSLTNSVG